MLTIINVNINTQNGLRSAKSVNVYPVQSQSIHDSLKKLYLIERPERWNQTYTIDLLSYLVTSVWDGELSQTYDAT